jgi:hypothetical protein
MKDKWLEIKRVERRLLVEQKVGKIDAVLWNEEWIVGHLTGLREFGETIK